MNTFALLLQADRRLAMLQMLERAPASQLNHVLLRDALETLGHKASLDTVLTDVYWLEEQCLVSIEALGSVNIVTLLPRGQDVAFGRCVVPGVKKPTPGQ